MSPAVGSVAGTPQCTMQTMWGVPAYQTGVRQCGPVWSKLQQCNGVHLQYCGFWRCRSWCRCMRFRLGSRSRHTNQRLRGRGRCTSVGACPGVTLSSLLGCALATRLAPAHLGAAWCVRDRKTKARTASLSAVPQHVRLLVSSWHSLVGVLC